MRRKGQSVAVQERTFRHITEEIRRAAIRGEMRAALELCLNEIEQFHSTAYPGCGGGCPAHEAMEAARAALGIPAPTI